MITPAGLATMAAPGKLFLMTDSMRAKPHAATPGGKLSAQVALVTGAASGIGRATAVLFAMEGARVAVTDQDAEGASRTAAEIQQRSGRGLALPLDVTSEDAWKAAVQETQRVWGPLQILVNCAGIPDTAPIAEMSLAAWRRVLAVNLDGAFLGTKLALRAMHSAGGAIVNVGSASGRKAYAHASAYCASKAALLQLTRVAALEGAPLGIRVNAVVPGGVKTPAWKQFPGWAELVREHGSEEGAWRALGAETPLHRFADPEEVARAILYLASDSASFLTGVELVLDGGLTA